VEAVGMHHWGPKQLLLTDMYVLYPEVTNPEDPNAVAVHELKPTRTKRAYLSREWAKIIQPVLVHTTMAFLKVCEPAVVLVYEKGPQHNCTAFLKCTHFQKQFLELCFTNKGISYNIQEQ